SSTIVGTEASYAEIHNVAMSKGRFFSAVDAAAGRRVVVINQKLADDMFGAAGDAVGQKLIIGTTPVTVCGVTKNQANMFSGGMESPIAYIPLKLYFAISNANGVWELDGSAVNRDKVEEASKQAIRILELRHRGQTKKVYQVFNMEQQADIANKAMSIVTMFISAIAAISLLVGGIGIMNIMLVSVTERTREIGVRMALGARRQDILVQFLIESMVLSLTGGLVGIGVGLGLTALLCAALKMPFIFSFPVVLGAVIFSMAVGVFFGLYPANRAAKLDPIDALRYE
ncbi:MAG: ABC transporter permease, partial [Candidatus Saccharibacteria bacterium]